MSDLPASFLGDDFLPWERLEGEPLAAYERFVTYLSLKPSERTLDNLRQILADQGQQVERRHLVAQSRQYRWDERAAAYEDEKQRIYALRVREELEEAAMRTASAARRMLEKAVSALDDLDIAKLSPTEIRQYIVDSAKLERLALGAPTDVIENRNEGRDYVAELAAVLGQELYTSEGEALESGSGDDQPS